MRAFLAHLLFGFDMPDLAALQQAIAQLAPALQALTQRIDAFVTSHPELPDLSAEVQAVNDAVAAINQLLPAPPAA